MARIIPRARPLRRRALRLVLPVVVSSALLVGGVSAGASAASDLSATGVSVTVTEGVATAAVTFSSTPAIVATKAGICVRSSTGVLLDFPSARSASIPISGREFRSARAFEAGTYRYWPCVLADGRWTAVGPKSTFSVDAPTSAPAPAPSTGAEMPVGDLPGWTQTFTEDFTTDLDRGSFPGPYADKWMSYDGFPDTSEKGDYDQSIISAHDGLLDLYLHTEDGRPRGAAPVPLVDGEWGGQTYGRFSVRMKTDPDLHGYGVAFLLWPDSGNWSDGEIDFPESALTENVKAYNHCVGNPQTNCYVIETDAQYTDWHTYTIDWTPSRLTYLVDGVEVGSTTTSIPDKPMHWVMQTETRVTPDPSTAGHLLIDWATIYRYTP